MNKNSKGWQRRQYELIFQEAMSIGIIDPDGQTKNGLVQMMTNVELRIRCLGKYGLMWEEVDGGKSYRFSKVFGKAKDELVAELYSHPAIVEYMRRRDTNAVPL